MSKEKYDDIDKLFEALREDPTNIKNFYRDSILNRSGPSSTDKQFYSDYIAQKLLVKLKQKNLFSDGINESRRGDYLTGHDGVTDEYHDSEKVFAKSLFGQPLERLGRIIDYEIPLTERKGKDKIDDPKNYGDIDLISLNDDTNTAYLIELKMADKKETLLRAALEIETYSQVVEEEPLNEFVNKKSERFGILKIDDLTINKAVLFAINDSKLPKELRPENRGRYPNLFKLLYKLNIGVFTIDYRYPTNIHINPWK